MTEDTSTLRIRLIENVRGFDGSILFFRGSVLKARIGLYSMIEVEVKASRYLPRMPNQWELVLTDEDLEQLLDAS